MIFQRGVTAEQRAAYYERISGGAWTAPPIDVVAQATEDVEAGELPAMLAETRAADDRDGTYRLSAYRAGPRIVMADGRATVHIVGPLDGFFGYNADRMAHFLDALSPTAIDVAVATPGGYLEQAFKTYADLRRRAVAGVPVNSAATGLVASAGLVVFAAGAERSAPVASRFMAHASHIAVFAMLNRKVLAAVRDDLDAVLQSGDEGQGDVYRAAGVAADTVEAWLDGDDHWLSRGDAEAAGLVTQPTGEAGDPQGDTAPAGSGDPEGGTDNGGAAPGADDAAGAAEQPSAEKAAAVAAALADFQRRRA